MNIRLNEDYRIITDRYQYTLYKIHEGKQKDGSESRVAIGHYSSTEKAIRALMYHEVKTSELDNLKDVVALINKVSKDITSKIESNYDTTLEGEN